MPGSQTAVREVALTVRCRDPRCPGCPELDVPCKFEATVALDDRDRPVGEVIGPDCRWPIEPDDLAEQVDRHLQSAALAASFDRRPRQGALREYLDGLRWAVACVAQLEYDQWRQDDDGVDPELGTGGICDRIADAVIGILDCDAVQGAPEGEDHAWVAASDGREVYLIDIPPGVYETGGGYNWRKLDGVVFRPEHVVIARIDDTVVEDLFGDDW